MVSISKKNTNVALVLSYLYKAVEVFCEYFKGTVDLLILISEDTVVGLLIGLGESGKRLGYGKD